MLKDFGWIFDAFRLRVSVSLPIQNASPSVSSCSPAFLVETFTDATCLGCGSRSAVFNEILWSRSAAEPGVSVGIPLYRAGSLGYPGGSLEGPWEGFPGGTPGDTPGNDPGDAPGGGPGVGPWRGPGRVSRGVAMEESFPHG